MSQPTLSIGLPVYNGENFIAEAIESLLAQTYTDFELIISDNCSTDGTQQICEKYAALDDRVRYHRAEENQGAKWNFPHVFSLATGKYFKWAAHDDVCHPEMIQRCIDVLDAEPDVVLVMPETALIDADSRLIIPQPNTWTSGCTTRADEEKRLRMLTSKDASQRYFGVLLMSLRCYEVFAVVRTEDMRRSGTYRGYNGSEKVFLAEMALMGRFVEIPEPLFYSRWHDSRFSSNTEGTGQNQLVDPKKSRKIAIPHEILCGVGYFRRILDVKISITDRLKCLAVWTRFILRPEKWGTILTKLFTGKSNTVELSPSLERGERIQVGWNQLQESAPAAGTKTTTDQESTHASA